MANMLPSQMLPPRPSSSPISQRPHSPTKPRPLFSPPVPNHSSLSSPASGSSPGPISSPRNPDSPRSQTQKFCVCKTTLTNHQMGDIQCDLCRNKFHSMCVGVSPIQPYTCEPCKQKHNSARSSCSCNSCDDTMKQNWISCDICQTWYHQNCVGITVESDNVDREFFCNKCTEADMEILTRSLTQLDYRLMINAFGKLLQSKYAWPLSSSNRHIPISMDRIYNKIKLQSYKCFKEFMDEMVDMFSRFRDYYSDAQLHSRESKCCEIVEYDFSNAVRDFIEKGKKQTRH